jgi:predicted ferric reductase
VGNTPASGITKLVMAEAQHFPEIAAFYQAEVMEPAHQLLRRVLQRGIDSGEFRAIDLDYGIHGLTAPLMFLMLWKHAMAPCIGPNASIDPVAFIDAQVTTLLQGLLTRSATLQG